MPRQLSPPSSSSIRPSTRTPFSAAFGPDTNGDNTNNTTPNAATATRAPRKPTAPDHTPTYTGPNTNPTYDTAATTDVARPRCASSTRADTRLKIVGNNTAVPAAAKTKPTSMTTSDGDQAITNAPNAATAEALAKTRRAWCSPIPPAANRVMATAPANTAGASAPSDAGDWS